MPDAKENRIPEIVQELQQIVEQQIHPLLDELDGFGIGWSSEPYGELNSKIGGFMLQLRALAEWQGMKRDDCGQWQPPQE